MKLRCVRLPRDARRSDQANRALPRRRGRQTSAKWDRFRKRGGVWPSALRISTGSASKNSLAKTIDILCRDAACYGLLHRTPSPPRCSPSSVDAQLLAQRGRPFHQRVVQRAEEVRELLLRPVEHVAREQAAARARVPRSRCCSGEPSTRHISSNCRAIRRPKIGVHIARGVEVAGFAELLLAAARSSPSSGS